jgi:hypothetical protein
VSAKPTYSCCEHCGLSPDFVHDEPCDTPGCPGAVPNGGEGR